jgi:hypothetical protein
VQHFFDWFRQHEQTDQPWLILGKGPTFALRDRYDLARYRLLSLNHAVREQVVRLAHVIDLDVVDACSEALRRHADYVVLPWYPHVDNGPGARPLGELVQGHPVLRTLADEGRLLWYDLSTAPRRQTPGPMVEATYFSAEAAVSLLALAGVRQVRSLGVDGGATYSADFDDLRRRTLLANGQPGFDLQFRGIARTILRTGVDFAPLDLPAPIALLIHSGQGSVLPDLVLEFSARQRTSMSLRVHRLSPAADPAEAWTAMAELSAERTGRRRAILLPSGGLVLDDLRGLWLRAEAPGDASQADAVRTGGDTRESVASTGPALITATDPGALSSTLSRLRTGGGTPTPMDVPARWKRRDRVEDGDTSFLIYERPELRPWLSRGHPDAHLWVATLIEAVEHGAVMLEQIRAEVRGGLIRPSLLEQVERGSPETALVSWSARRRDEAFVPPEGPQPSRTGFLGDPLLLLRALARQARRQAALYRRRA